MDSLKSMPRSGGRLNLMGALNRNAPPSHLNPLSSEPGSKHASICRLERELKVNCLVHFLIIFLLVKLVRLRLLVRVRLLAKAVLVRVYC